MNVDLEKVLEIARESFKDAQASSNVVEFERKELSWQDINAITGIVVEFPRARPWVFRSGKNVKVVIFVVDAFGDYVSGLELQGAKVE